MSLLVLRDLAGTWGRDFLVAAELGALLLKHSCAGRQSLPKPTSGSHPVRPGR
jgi:hypothetical protein